MNKRLNSAEVSALEKTTSDLDKMNAIQFYKQVENYKKKIEEIKAK
ncbi:MAG TPA: hypothetical protein VIY47_07820 [Ignavibacteriaceae bacterium]